MIHINLKKLISKPDISLAMKNLVAALDPSIAIWDAKGTILIGNANSLEHLSLKYPIQTASETVGWVTGSEKAELFVQILSYIANQELEKKTLAIETLEKYEEINFLYEISSKFAVCVGIKEIIEFVISEAQKLIGGTNISVMLMNEETKKLEIIAARGQENNQKTVMEAGVGIAGHVLASGQAEIVNDVDSDPRYIPGENQINSLLCAPLITPNGTLGVINISNANPTHYTAQDLKRFKALAAPAAVAIENARLYEQLKEYSRNLEQQVAQRTAELEKANQELQRLASLDGLTQVGNRRRFDEYLMDNWQRLINEIAPMSLIMCDVDCFKSYNDSYGHLMGDDCLQRIAKAITCAVKHPAYLVARYGGEEFAIVLPNTSARGGMYIAETIKIEIEWLKIPHICSSVSKYVTVSLGVSSTIPSEQNSPQDLIAAADRALYEAKNQGRDRIVFQALPD
jgi:diguanylate cyclase (GGDEF)-like protein